MTIGRRHFLRTGLAAATGLIWAGWVSEHVRAAPDSAGRDRILYDDTLSFNALYDDPPMLGRVEFWLLPVYQEPSWEGQFVRYLSRYDIVPIYRAIHGGITAYYAHNDVWFDIGDGYVHSSHVVPVREILNEPEETVSGGFFGEITVPISWQREWPTMGGLRHFGLAYGTVYWVVERQDDPSGGAWYRLEDDLDRNAIWWVQAEHVRRIHDEEFMPISPEVPPEEKRIEISIGQQLLTCYQGDVPVFQTRVATGTTFLDAQGNPHYFQTAYGDYVIVHKQPSRRMVGPEGTPGGAFDLPGVPWVSYFTVEGGSIHGTYWHNDYGRPRSHGCVNVTADAAKWIYRWSYPSVGNVRFYEVGDEEQERSTPIAILE